MAITGNISDTSDALDMSTLSPYIFPNISLQALTLQPLMDGDIRVIYIFNRSIEFVVNKINEGNPSYMLSTDEFLQQVLLHLSCIDTIIHFGHYGNSNNNGQYLYSQDFTKYEINRKSKYTALNDEAKTNLNYYVSNLNQLLTYVIPCLHGIKTNVQQQGLPSFYIYVWAFLMCYHNKYNELKTFAQMQVSINDTVLYTTDDTNQTAGIGQSYIMLYYSLYSGNNFNPDIDQFLQFKFDPTTSLLFKD